MAAAIPKLLTPFHVKDSRVTPELPDTLAELLTLAIADARSLDPESYRPVSSCWHGAVSQGPCKVCLAGSVMAGSLCCSPDDSFLPWMFSPATYHKLKALDDMRTGNWLQAFCRVHKHRPVLSARNRLVSLPFPACSGFMDWEPFNAHLDSLETIVPRLREIELDARKA